MPVDAPTRPTPTRTPITRDAHGIVPFNRRGSEPSEDKKLDNGGGNGGKPPVGGSGKGGGDNKRYCRELIKNVYDSTPKYVDNNSEQYLKNWFKYRFFRRLEFILDFNVTKINKLTKSLNIILSKIEHFKNIGDVNKLKINMINRDNDVADLKKINAKYRNELKTAKKILTDLLGRCKNYLTPVQLKDMIEAERLANEHLEQLNKLDTQVNSISKGIHKIFLTPLTILKPVSKTQIQRIPVNILPDNPLNYDNQAINFSNAILRMFGGFVNPKPQKQTAEQFHDQIIKEQRAEMNRRKMDVSNNSVDKLIYYAPVMINILRAVPIAF